MVCNIESVISCLNTLVTCPICFNVSTVFIVEMVRHFWMHDKHQATHCIARLQPLPVPLWNDYSPADSSDLVSIW